MKSVSLRCKECDLELAKLLIRQKLQDKPPEKSGLLCEKCAMKAYEKRLALATNQ